jgi:hypothetical protein
MAQVFFPYATVREKLTMSKQLLKKPTFMNGMSNSPADVL